MNENVLYSDLRAEAFQLLSSGDIPKTLIFCEGSAYCKDFYKTTYEIIIPNIDILLDTDDLNSYHKKIMVNNKNRLSQILYALKNKDNWNIDLKKWNEQNLAFSSYKLSN
jgi:hypothetical protein